MSSINISPRSLRNRFVKADFGEIEPDMQDYVSFRIDRGVEPEPLTVDFDDRLIEHDLERISPVELVEIRLLHPIMKGRFCTDYTQTINYRISIGE